MKIKSKTLISAALISLVATSYALVSCKKKSDTEDENFKYTLKSDDTYELTSAKHSLVIVNIPEEINKTKITSVGKNAFSNQNQLTTVNISNNLESINYAAFMNCEKLTKVNFANESHLETIASHAFCGASSLMIDTFPSSIKEIGDFAFQFNRGISLIYLPKTIETLGAFAFEGCSNAIFFIEEKEIPTNWDKTWNNANRPYLLDVDPEYGEVETRGNFKVLINGDEAHLIGIINQSELTGELSLPISVNGIPVTSMISNLFSPSAKNSSLTSLIIPDSYGEPDVHCFDGLNCANLYFIGDEQVSREWITQFEEIHNGSAVYTSLSSSVTLNDINYVCARSDGNGGVLTTSNSTSSELTIPSNITFPNEGTRNINEIAPRAFRDNKNLTKITTAREQHIIGAYAFYNCSNLKTLVLGDAIKIGKRAFSGSSSMSNIDTINAVSPEVIEEEAFKKTSQKQINIEKLFPQTGGRTHYIGPGAFQNCLLDGEDIYLIDNLEKVGQYTFNCASDTTTFHVSSALFSKMKGWGYKITEYPGYYKIDSATKPFGNGRIVVS